MHQARLVKQLHVAHKVHQSASAQGIDLAQGHRQQDPCDNIEKILGGRSESLLPSISGVSGPQSAPRRAQIG